MLFPQLSYPRYHALRVPHDLPSEAIELTTNLGGVDKAQTITNEDAEAAERRATELYYFQNPGEVNLSHGLVGRIPQKARTAGWTYQDPANFSFERGMVSTIDRRQAELRSERVLASIKRWLASVNEAHESCDFETQDLEFGPAPDESSDKKGGLSGFVQWLFSWL